MANSEPQGAFVTSGGEELMLLSRAAKEFGVSQNYLRFSIFNKKLQGVKIKGVWYTTRPWLDEYFRSIIPRKAKPQVNAAHTELSFDGGKLSSVRASQNPDLEIRLSAMERSLQRAEKRLLTTWIIALLITAISVSAALEIFPMEMVKKMASEVQLPVEVFPRLVGTRPQKTVAPRLNPDQSGFQPQTIASSLSSSVNSFFQNTRSQISIYSYKPQPQSIIDY